MKFLVVIATIRESLPGFDETMERIRGTFGPDTEFHILDGHGGKAQALNRARTELLLGTDADCYVTMDDDVVPGQNWQQVVEAAFRELPRYGAFGLWISDDPAMGQLQGAAFLEPEARTQTVGYRRVKPPHHINGGFIAFRTDVAIRIGDIPTEGVRYQLWEDAWRGRTVRKLGWEMALLTGVGVDMVEYPDPSEYIEQKARETAFGKETSESLLSKEGLGDPLFIRLRKFVARARGRTK